MKTTRTTKRDGKANGIAGLKVARTMVKENLRGKTGSERERIWEEMQEIEAKLRELGA